MTNGRDAFGTVGIVGQRWEGGWEEAFGCELRNGFSAVVDDIQCWKDWGQVFESGDFGVGRSRPVLF